MNVTWKKLTVGPLEENCYIVYDEENKEKTCFLIDPGAAGTRILNAVKALSLTPEAIYLTHGHFDHIMAVDWVRKEFPKLPVYALDAEKEVLLDPEKNFMKGLPAPAFLTDVTYVKDGERLLLAGIPCEVMATPGHTVGSSCLCIPEAGVLFSGDTIFRESAGRTDFPTGSTMDLSVSINDVLMKLPDDMKVYPGHGDETTIGYERNYNFMVILRNRE